MSDLQNFVTKIVDLWKLHQHRENAYRQAMALEDLGSLRRICSHGYISSLLFKKETQWIYDQVKCTLNDGDICHTLKDESNAIFIFPWEDKPSIAHLLQEQELKAIKIYKTLLGQRSMTQDANSIFADHLEKLHDINYSLSKELSKISPKLRLLKYPIARTA